MSKNRKAKIERQQTWDEERFDIAEQFMTSFPQEHKPTLPVKGVFLEEIKAMLYVYGDVRYPLAESVSLVEEIVYDQMCDVLVRAAEVSSMRSSRGIGVEEFSFLLRRSLDKLNRFVARMKFLDSHKKILHTTEQGGDDPEFGFPADKNHLKRYKKCIEFISQIDEGGELTRAAMKYSVDDVKIKRLERAEKQTRDMNTQEYREYVKLRRIGFTTRRSVNHTQKKKLQDWFDLEKLQIPVQVSEYGWEAMEYLAQETVAEIVDKALLVRSEVSSPLLYCELEPDARHLPLYSSSTLVGRAETLSDTSSSDDGPAITQVNEGPLNRKLALTPSDIREAMRRFVSNSQRNFLTKTQLPISRKILCLD